MAEGVVDVVAAVIRRGERLLVGQRPQHKRHGGLWEFPGGKLLDGESLVDAARRELREELRLEVSRAGSEVFSAHDPGSPFVIRFVELHVDGDPEPLEHSQLGWFTPSELQDMPLAPSDAAFVRWVRDRTG